MQVPCQRSRPCKFRAKVVRRIGTVLAKGDIIKEAGGGVVLAADASFCLAHTNSLRYSPIETSL